MVRVLACRRQRLCVCALPVALWVFSIFCWLCSDCLAFVAGHGLSRTRPTSRFCSRRLWSLVRKAQGGGSNKLLAKLRKKAEGPKLNLQLSSTSSALPPGYLAPLLTAKVHALLAEHPDWLQAAQAASDFSFSPLVPGDAADVAALSQEWFPNGTYSVSPAWWEELLSDGDVVGVKVHFPQDEAATPLGIAVAITTKRSIEKWMSSDNVDVLRRDALPSHSLTWDEPADRSLAYVFAVGVCDELRRRGLGVALLEAMVGQVTTQASCVFALAIADYNRAAAGLYQTFGFKMLTQQQGVYKGAGRRTHNGCLMTYKVPGVG